MPPCSSQEANGITDRVRYQAVHVAPRLEQINSEMGDLQLEIVQHRFFNLIAVFPRKVIRCVKQDGILNRISAMLPCPCFQHRQRVVLECVWHHGVFLLHYGISAACMSRPATSGSSRSRLYAKFLATAFRSQAVRSIRSGWRTLSIRSTTDSSNLRTMALFDLCMYVSVDRH